MPTRIALENTVSRLLELLGKVLQEKKGKKPEAPSIYEDIKKWFEDHQYWFPKLTHFEGKLLGEILELEQCIDNARYDGVPDAKLKQVHDGGMPDAEPKQGIDNATHGDGKLETIKKCFERIQDLIKKNQLDQYEVPPSMKEAAQSEGRKMSDEWRALGIEESILESPAMATLELSYTILDIRLKMCLLCFAIFPEKASIMKKPLIYWWIGEGFVRKTKEKTAEEAGEEAFQNLIDMGLIDPEYKKAKENGKQSPVVDSCTMHPWIRRMVITVAKKAEFFDLDRRGAPTSVSSQSYRICFAKDLKIDQTVNPPNTNKPEDEPPSSTLFDRGQKDQLPFVTLFNIDQKYLDIKWEWFSKLNRVSVLQLGRWQHAADHHIEVENQDFLKHLGALTHLKYLSLRGMSRITELPSSVLDLVLLQILDLRACHNLERLPSDISSLRRLTHLDLSECYLLEGMPKGLDKLFSLQVLKGFVIETSRSSSGKLVDLSHLKKLRKLSIYIGSRDLTQEVELRSLKDIENLRVLTITWKEVKKVGVKGSSQSKEEGEKVEVQSFSFPPKLEKLDLRCIPFQKQPEWLKPSNLESLKKLYIRGGKLKILGSETGTWNAEIVRLKYLDDLDIKQLDKSGEFPALIYYEKIRCHKNQNIYDEDEVWAKENHEDERASAGNISAKREPVAPAEDKDEREEKTKEENNLEESMKDGKQDNEKALIKAETQEAKTSKVVSNASDHAALASNKDHEEEKETKLGEGVPNKVEDAKASSSNILRNEPNLTTTSGDKEETKVEESKGLVKQGDNDQVLNKVEHHGGSTNKFIPSESNLVSPVI